MFIMPREERRAYLSRVLPYLMISLTMFAVGIVVGMVIVYRVPGLADYFASTLAEFVKMFAGIPRWKLAGAIFLNNALKTLMAILLGMAFGVVPGIFLLANGVALGVALSLSVQARGLWPSLLSILPHGVLELPAVFLGTSIGLLLGIQAIKRLFGRSEIALGTELADAMRYYFTVIVPLLLLAALVEAYLTAAFALPR
jgi:stage II sporulation protein M